MKLSKPFYPGLLERISTDHVVMVELSSSVGWPAWLSLAESSSSVNLIGSVFELSVTQTRLYYDRRIFSLFQLDKSIGLLSTVNVHIAVLKSGKTLEFRTTVGPQAIIV